MESMTLNLFLCLVLTECPFVLNDCPYVTYSIHVDTHEIILLDRTQKRHGKGKLKFVCVLKSIYAKSLSMYALNRRSESMNSAAELNIPLITVLPGEHNNCQEPLYFSQNLS